MFTNNNIYTIIIVIIIVIIVLNQMKIIQFEGFTSSQYKYKYCFKILDKMLNYYNNFALGQCTYFYSNDNAFGNNSIPLIFEHDDKYFGIFVNDSQMSPLESLNAIHRTAKIELPYKPMESTKTINQLYYDKGIIYYFLPTTGVYYYLSVDNNNFYFTNNKKLAVDVTPIVDGK